jgi:peptidoglycan hydrolase-like protein with peptidoglycan-binding domain
VKKLQQILIDEGFLKTKSGIPTGYFGELTASALEKYQKSGGSPASKTSSSQTLSQIKPPLLQSPFRKY